jgi:hypothetical protein
VVLRRRRPVAGFSSVAVSFLAALGLPGPVFSRSAPPCPVFLFSWQDFSPVLLVEDELFGRWCSIQSLSDSVPTTGAALHSLLRFFISTVSSFIRLYRTCLTSVSHFVLHRFLGARFFPAESWFWISPLVRA